MSLRVEWRSAYNNQLCKGIVLGYAHKTDYVGIVAIVLQDGTKSEPRCIVDVEIRKLIPKGLTIDIN